MLAGRATSEPVVETAGFYGETAMNTQNFSATFFRYDLLNIYDPLLLLIPSVHDAGRDAPALLCQV